MSLRSAASGAVALGLLTGVLAAVPASTASAATPGKIHPAIGTAPHYVIAGHARPDATFTCQTTVPAECYGPAQVRAAYGVDKLAATGAGRTIVIIDAYQSPTITHDLATFNTLFGLPSSTFTQVAPDGLTPFDVNDPNMTGWAGEITLDVEWAHAIAPGAAITLVLAKSNDDADILSATDYAITHDLGDVISQSFGEAEQCMDPALLTKQHALFVKAAAKRITLLASSGDQGSAQPSCDGETFIKAASTPATDPLVTAVGGTVLDADGLTGAYHSETTWNEPDYASAGGGGYSVKYRVPAYQALLGTRVRAVPDVSYNASINAGVLAVWSSSGFGDDLVFGFGGTSAGSPQWAGLVALADQLGHGRAGQLNPVLYTASLLPPVYTGLFHDITTGDNTYHGDVTIPGYAAHRGWDPATGLGTPKAKAVVTLLALAA